MEAGPRRTLPPTPTRTPTLTLTLHPDPNQAEAHYTEQLALLPAHTMHQYYESRIAADGTSAVDGQPFRQVRVRVRVRVRVDPPVRVRVKG